MNINKYPIIILHGWGSSAKRWSAVKQSLEEKGYSVFVPDLPGFGKEPAPNRPWLVEDYVEWVKEYSEKNNLANFVLIGHSFGGGIAAVFAAKYPEKIRQLILVAAAIRRQKTAKQRAFFMVSKIAKILFSLPFCSHFHPFAQKAFYKLAGVTDYITPSIQKSPIMKETFKKVISNDLASFLPNIKVPAVILWGEKDRITPLSDGHFIQKAIPGSHLEIITGENHDINIKAPEKLAEKIVQFLIHPQW